ncbi:hypothetical protein NTE_02427 [Candidatus Nitrososphaera evergladensis SR1]|jgi:hypothetical protein|uniref:Uncharacterized protein n=1 Tax=Candidatus Nitrososphaera evergladensis SR1 TaxID=1459636 RepID=A0A075MUY6_9ARCH|nr:hypothetical protein [Candidatus Nitrososphaera evergladensis]AIF84477.1 hypothetical protein NTE_02427 [Candidatus Nitrososphaera evergladensis SR1]
MLPQSSSAKGAMENGAKYGAIAGLIATWSISTAIAASELELGLPIGTFYAVMGTSLGAGGFGPAAYLGFGLHLLTGALLGAVIGLLMCRFFMIKFLNPYRAVAAGIGAGVGVWLVLFLPVTALLVQPSIARISFLLAESMPLQSAVLGNASQFVWGIALSAIAFHLVWGAIFGYTASAFLRIRAFRMTHPEKGMMQ